MKNIKALVLIGIAATIVSCGKKNSPAANTTTLEVSVSEGNSKDVSTGTTVALYESAAAVTGNSPKYTQTTNASGKADFTVAYLAKYYVIAHKGSAKNFYAGYIPVGIFTTDTEISYSPAQTPPGVVGGVKFQDTNGDEIITASDIVAAPSAALTANTDSYFTTAIY